MADRGIISPLKRLMSSVRISSLQSKRLSLDLANFPITGFLPRQSPQACTSLLTPNLREWLSFSCISFCSNSTLKQPLHWDCASLCRFTGPLSHTSRHKTYLSSVLERKKEVSFLLPGRRSWPKVQSLIQLGQLEVVPPPPAIATTIHQLSWQTGSHGHSRSCSRQNQPE